MKTNNFENFRKLIKDCKECDFKNKHSEPFYFNNFNPSIVKCLVVTEQPKESKDIINEELAKKDLKSQLNNNKGSTRGWLINIFEETFANSIIMESGKYYWSHHTKCPSSKREFKEKCLKLWFEKELLLFENLSHVISFGAESFRGIVNLSKNYYSYDFYDYFWNEIEMIVKEEIINEKLTINLFGKDYLYLALPHPSSANPLSNMLKKFNYLIEHFKNGFLI